ncbi:lipooligosaccharide transport system permease protein [Microbacteriaceae bacterium MWH-Ta3]|nr:lipooligosaccharide transport system permease protein [Microbacteriaceae bacterium MWH-Ta3]
MSPIVVPRRRFGGLYAGNVRAVIERGLRATKSSNKWVVLSGFFEPVFYLLSLGIGLGSIIGSVQINGVDVSYGAYIAPALLAVSAMNGAIYDSTWNVFFKLNYGKIYQTMLTTSLGPVDVALGEISLALLRGAVYAMGFLVVMQVMGLVLSPLAILAIPAVILIAAGFASIGMAITSFMKTFQQMDWINLFLLPMFLFSATFYPITVYAAPIQGIVQALPLWHAVELIRGLTTGVFGWEILGHIAYFVVMFAIGIVFTSRRLRALFLG